MRLLIVKPSSLGDVIHAFPAVELLRRHLGESLEKLTWVVNDSLKEMVELYPGVDRIVCFPRNSLLKRGRLRAFLKDLREDSYDAAIDFQGLLRSGLMSWASRAPRRIGFATGRECSPWFYTERYVPSKDCLHAVDKNIDLIRQAFPGSDALPAEVPPLIVGKERMSEAEALLSECGTTGPVIAVGCSSRWNSKNWPVSFFAAVLDDVVSRCPDARIWILGTPSERQLGEALVASCKAAKPLNLAGRTRLMGLVGLLAQSRVLLTNDSGPMHIAAALRTPTVALFGATDPELTGPYGRDIHTVFRSGCPHAPCFKKNCPYPQQPCSAWTVPKDVADSVLQKISSFGIS